MNKTKEKTKEKMLATNSQKLFDGEMGGPKPHHKLCHTAMPNGTFMILLLLIDCHVHST